MKYELICGLETHIELSTKSKIFCSCGLEFGAEPNSFCCPVCSGMPGALPVLNENVIKFAIMMGHALGSKINLNSTMERKSYVYPDLPKAYQISQNLNPICIGGKVLLSNGKEIRINHIHIEEDAGKIIHKNNSLYVDYNRSGTPLIEIVSEPDIRNSEEAKEYIEALIQTAKFLKISDGRMQEGSVRCDVNISLREKGNKNFGTRVEIKNMNSINFICKVIEYEYERQCDILNKNDKVKKETRKYIEETNSTEGMRNKEDSIDYRYFAEPDIKSIKLTQDFVENIKKEIPELPKNRIEKYKLLGISEKISVLISNYVKISDFLDETLKLCKNPITAANFIVGPIFYYLETENKKEEFCVSFTPNEFSHFINLVANGKINQNNAKKIIEKSLKNNENLKKNSEKFIKNDDNFDIFSVCKEVIESNKKAVTDYKNGKEKAFQSLIGSVMKITKGKADVNETNKIIIDLIKNFDN